MKYATKKIGDILDDRRNFKLQAYFMRFSFEARKHITHRVVYMNADYGAITKIIFSKAQVSIDRFHVIQQLTSAVNKQRIQAMNQFKKSDPQAMKDYRKMKKHWRTILKKNAKINDTFFKQYSLFQRNYLTESEVLDHLLSVNDQLRESYAVYQDVLTAFDAKDFEAFFEISDHLPVTLDTGFKKVILYLNKQKKAIINSLKFPYSNGKLEGKNNLIKVIKRIAFGFKTFRNLRKCVLIQQNLCEMI